MIEKMWEKYFHPDDEPPIVSIIKSVVLFSITIVILPISFVAVLLGYKNCYYCCTPISHYANRENITCRGSWEDGDPTYRVCMKCVNEGKKIN